jgi:hypothetical protein
LRFRSAQLGRTNNKHGGKGPVLFVCPVFLLLQTSGVNIW